MSAAALAGAPAAQALRTRTEDNVASLRARGVRPRLAVVVATTNEATHRYVRSIARAAGKAGIECDVVDVGPHATQEEIAGRLRQLSADDAVHGIILQTPLPEGVRADVVVAGIDPGKDVDGANPLSLGRLAVGQEAFAPATARAVVDLLEHHGVPLAGRRVTIVGRSAVVGKPLLHLLLDRDAAVTVCHSRSGPLAGSTRRADVVVAAAGRPGLVAGEHLGSGAVVVDVGTNVLEDGRLVGDVEPESAAAVASALSPVPGGVGTVTTAVLMLHTTQAALHRLDRVPVAAAPGAIG